MHRYSNGKHVPGVTGAKLGQSQLALKKHQHSKLQSTVYLRAYSLSTCLCICRQSRNTTSFIMHHNTYATNKMCDLC